MSNILFTEPINKSDHTGLKTGRIIPEGRIERYSTNE